MCSLNFGDVMRKPPILRVVMHVTPLLRDNLENGEWLSITGAVEEAIVWSTTMMDWRKWWWEFSPHVNSSPWYVSSSRGSFADDFKPKKRLKILIMKVQKKEKLERPSLVPVEKYSSITWRQRYENKASKTNL